MGSSLRALVGARVSVLTGPQKVSHIAQHDTGQKYARDKGYDVVGTFQDLDVSATVSPFERPDLGPWLSPEKQDDWDVLVFSKIDRMFRSTRDCVKFAEWAEERKKILVFAEDSMTLNYRDKSDSLEKMMSELFIYIGSFFAQLELNRFKSRARDSHRVLRGMDRWACGVPPLGFRVVDHPSGKGKGLDTDPEGRALLYQMAGKLLDGWSFIRIAGWLNEQGALTNMDRARQAKGHEPKARPWTVNTVIDALTSPRTQGLKMTGRGRKATTVLDSEGSPIRMAPPTFDSATWSQIQEAAAKRQLAPRSRTQSVNPMLGIGFCGVCGSSLAQQFTRKKTNPGVVYRYYRCGRTPINCTNVFARADDIDEVLRDSFLANWGSAERTRRVFVPGEDRTEELEQVLRTIDRLRKESDEGLIVTAEDEETYISRLKALIARRTALEATPRRSSQWAVERTGETYSDAYFSSEDRRQLLVDAGFRLELYSGKPLRLELFPPQRPDTLVIR